MDLCSKGGGKYSVNYSLILDKLKNIDFNNGLSQEDNYKLFETPFIEEAIFLIVKGLKTLYGEKDVKLKEFL